MHGRELRRSLVVSVEDMRCEGVGGQWMEWEDAPLPSLFIVDSTA